MGKAVLVAEWKSGGGWRVGLKMKEARVTGTRSDRIGRL